MVPPSETSLVPLRPGAEPAVPPVTAPAAAPAAAVLSGRVERFWFGATEPAGPIELVSGPAASVDTPNGTVSSPPLKLIWAATATGTASSTAQSALRPAMRWRQSLASVSDIETPG
jgi:hypothetical protein